MTDFQILNSISNHLCGGLLGGEEQSCQIYCRELPGEPVFRFNDGPWKTTLRQAIEAYYQKFRTVQPEQTEWTDTVR